MSTDNTNGVLGASTFSKGDDNLDPEGIFAPIFDVLETSDWHKETSPLDIRLQYAREMYSDPAYCDALVRNFSRIPMDFIVQGDEESLRVLRDAKLDLTSYGACARGVYVLLSGHGDDCHARRAYACADAMTRLMRRLGRAWKAQEDRLRDTSAKPSRAASRPRRRSYRWPDYTSYNCYLDAQGDRRLLRTFTTLAFMPAVDFANGIGRVGTHHAGDRLYALLDRRCFTGHGLDREGYRLILEYLNLLDDDDDTSRRLRYELVVEPFSKLPPGPRRRSR